MALGKKEYDALTDIISKIYTDTSSDERRVLLNAIARKEPRLNNVWSIYSKNPKQDNIIRSLANQLIQEEKKAAVASGGPVETKTPTYTEVEAEAPSYLAKLLSSKAATAASPPPPIAAAVAAVPPPPISAAAPPQLLAPVLTKLDPYRNADLKVRRSNGTVESGWQMPDDAAIVSGGRVELIKYTKDKNGQPSFITKSVKFEDIEELNKDVAATYAAKAKTAATAMSTPPPSLELKAPPVVAAEPRQASGPTSSLLEDRQKAYLTARFNDSNFENWLQRRQSQRLDAGIQNTVEDYKKFNQYKQNFFLNNNNFSKDVVKFVSDLFDKYKISP
ncbi:hypothetical protein EB001_27470, partial [bacterium]|nr:hypothetical protein [bacterium]